MPRKKHKPKPPANEAIANESVVIEPSNGESIPIESVVINPSAKDESTPVESVVINPSAKDESTPKESVVITPSAKDESSPKESVVITPSAKDESSPKEPVVINPSADESTPIEPVVINPSTNDSIDSIDSTDSTDPYAPTITNIIKNPVFRSLIRRNLAFHLTQNVLLCIGCAIGAMVLIGALLAGSSLRGSLKKLHEPRIGEVRWALSSQSGNFRASIADSISARLPVKAAPILPLTGSAGVAGGSESVHRVNIIGIDGRFRDLGRRQAAERSFGDSSAVVNSALAKKLGVSVNDDIVLRFQTVGSLAMEAPFGRRDNLFSLRLKVEHIADSDDFGDFSLRAEHFDVYNVFVSLKLLQAVNDMPEMATMILIGESRTVTGEQIVEVVRGSVSIKDAGLNIRSVDNDFEIYSDRVFISERLAGLIAGAVPKAVPISSWFVNSIDRQGASYSTPYSFVSTPPVDYRLAPNEIALSDWAAADLVAAIGDTVALAYFVPLPASGLRADTAKFVVSAFIGDTIRWLDRSLMPPYPGLANAGSCNDWDPSIPVDLSRIRPKDEEYWEKYAGTPKAVISHAAAARIWENRFGATTAMRVPGSEKGADINDSTDIDDGTDINASNNNKNAADSVERAITRSLTPAICGLTLTDAGTDIRNAVNNGTDFAPIFTGLSFFTFAAALLLVWLLSTLHVRYRANERGILRALGYSEAQTALIYLAEGAIVFAVGTVAGMILGPLYTLAVMYALKTVSAAQMPELGLHVSAGAVITGGAAAFVCAMASMAAPLLPLFKKKKQDKRVRPCRLTPLLSARTFDKNHLIARNILHNRKRAVGEAAILACALVILGTTQLFHKRPVSNPALRTSGTGGFYWYGELTSGIPLEETGNDFLRERGAVIDHSTGGPPVPMRMRDGDDASCLNMNRAIAPAIVGVNPNTLDSLGAFSFASFADMQAKGGRLGGNGNGKSGVIDQNHPWLILGTPTDSENTVYGFADANTIKWGLGKTLGDTLIYVNERGGALNVILAAGLENSILQGKVIIAESDFIRHYPSVNGYRLLLLSPPVGMEHLVADVFRTYHDKSGLQLTPSTARLNAFGAVENSYLSIFALLGMTGLALGCLGLGIVAARSIEERRHEFAVLTAQGFGIDTIKRILFAEHAAVAAVGTVAGLLPAFIASVAAGADVRTESILRIIYLTIIVLSCGAGAILIGLRKLRGSDLIEVLKGDA